jgi:hypothetical protein
MVVPGDMTASDSPPRWVLEKGGEARVLETDGDRITLESTRAFPPGAPLIAQVEGSSDTYRVKVRGSRRISDALFRVEGRLVNLSREAREKLLGSKPEAP